MSFLRTREKFLRSRGFHAYTEDMLCNLLGCELIDLEVAILEATTEGIHKKAIADYQKASVRLDIDREEFELAVVEQRRVIEHEKRQQGFLNNDLQLLEC